MVQSNSENIEWSNKPLDRKQIEVQVLSSLILHLFVLFFRLLKNERVMRLIE